MGSVRSLEPQQQRSLPVSSTFFAEPVKRLTPVVLSSPSIKSSLRDGQECPGPSSKSAFSLAQIPLFPPEHRAGPKKNTTGLPDALKARMEHLSSLSLDDVQVHYSSPKPARVQALAYAQGTHIYVGPRQEQHLAHEAWHVVQQKQGRVKPTLQMKGMAINDDQRLEREADVRGGEVAASSRQEGRSGHINPLPLSHGTRSFSVAQLKPRKLDEQYVDVLNGIARELGIDPDTVTFLQDDTASSSRNVYGERTIIFTTAILKAGGDRLRFVAGHELGHLVSKDLYWMLTYSLTGALAIGFIAWGIGAGIALGALGVVSSLPYFFLKASQHFEKKADFFSATRLPGAAKGGVEHMNAALEENKDERHDILGFLYTEDGDNKLDLLHPPLTVRKTYLQALIEGQAKHSKGKID